MKQLEIVQEGHSFECQLMDVDNIVPEYERSGYFKIN